MPRLRAVGVLFSIVTLMFVLNAPVASQAQASGERKVVERVEPVYPALAKRTNVRGVVKLEVSVKANGTVKAIKVIGGNPVLLDAANDAVRKWKFEAGPDETTETVRISFEPR